MILNKNKLQQMLSPDGKVEIRQKTNETKVMIRDLLRSKDLTGMIQDVVDAVKNTLIVTTAFYEIMFEVEMEARLFAGTEVDDALEGTIKSMMDRGSSVMGEMAADVERFESLKEQLDKNRGE